MRTYDILSITPSNTVGVPSVITLDTSHGDVTRSFHGREWIDPAGTTVTAGSFVSGVFYRIVSVGTTDFTLIGADSNTIGQVFQATGAGTGTGTASNYRLPYDTFDTDTLTATPSPPEGTSLLVATTFDIVGNANRKYNGRYTTYTQITVEGLGGTLPSEFSAGSTSIRIAEAMEIDGVGTELTTGQITNISTYYITVYGEDPILVLETQHVDTRGIEFVGRKSSYWGEVINQNAMRVVQTYAGPSAPPDPFIGQMWYNTTDERIYINTAIPAAWQGTGAGIPFYEAKASSTSWVVNHNFNLASPFVANVTAFILTGGFYKIVSPADITFNSANQLTITFSSAQEGYVSVRRPD